MKVAIYSRVSTDKQEAINQSLKIQEYCREQQHEIYGVYQDVDSGKEPDRKYLNIMLDHAKEHHFNLVIVWSLDRLSREGVRKTIYYLELLESLGIGFKSYSEPFLDTLGPWKEVVISILSTLAKLERVKISERTKAGLERARAEGKTLGRPRTPESTVTRVNEMLSMNYSITKIKHTLAAVHNISLSRGKISQLRQEYIKRLEKSEGISHIRPSKFL